MEMFVAVIVGLMLGSFASVLICRWPHWRGVVDGRSQCARCERALAWYELVPLASWFFLRGRCRSCKQSIAMFYPMLECCMAGTFGAYAYRLGISSAWNVIDLFILFLLVALLFFDLRNMVLPNIFIVLLAAAAFARIVFFQSDAIAGALYTAAALGIVFLLLHAFSGGRWLGFGDVKLAVAIGVLFGYPDAISVTMVAIWVGALVGLGMILFGRASLRTALPFGAFWTAVSVFTILWPGPVHFLSASVIPILQ